MPAQTNGVEMGPEMLPVPIPSACKTISQSTCKTISQIAIGTANVRMVGKPEVIWLRLDQPMSRSARNTGFQVK
jgi:hypothetical protein